MKTRSTLTLLAAAVLLFAGGCGSSRYVINDTLERDYYTGVKHQWWDLEHAKRYTLQDANRVVAQMRRVEEGGYTDVPPYSIRIQRDSNHAP
ncbi:MAG: hypothetical protein V4587_00285 [Acidobacteriota bacterium]